MNKKKEYLEEILGIPFLGGNRVRVLKNGDEIFPAMLQRMEEAEETINLLTYVYWTGNIADRFAEVLSRKAADGVSVRVVLDSFGAAQMPDRLSRKMVDSGVDVSWFRPLKNPKLWRIDRRTHRKVLTCDGKVAFTGGVGIAQEWEGDARNPDEWRDTHFEVQGPAVDIMSGAFWGNWLEMNQHRAPDLTPKTAPRPDAGTADVQVVRSQAAGDSSDAANVMKCLLHLAEKSLIITTPYFVLDDVFLDLLKSKAESGVAISLLIPGPHLDQRFERWATRDEFDQLLAAGVRIFRYQKTMLHAKIIIVDEELTCVGSANFNQRSLCKDHELLMLVQDSDVTDTLLSQFHEDLQDSRETTDTEWRHRGLISRVGEWVLKPFTQQL